MIVRGSVLAIVASLFISALNAQLFLTYGAISYRKDFSGQLNTWKRNEWGNPIQIVGFHVNGPGAVTGSSGKRKTYLDVQFNQFISQKIAINDSVTGAISGCSFGYSEGYDLFKKSKTVDLAIGGGLNLGRLKLTQNTWNFFDLNSRNLHLKNRLICPKAMLQFRLVTKYISFMAMAEFQYDISGSDWKEKRWSRRKPDSYPVSGFNQTGICCFVGIGYTFSNSTGETEF